MVLSTSTNVRASIALLALSHVRGVELESACTTPESVSGPQHYLAVTLRMHAIGIRSGAPRRTSSPGDVLGLRSDMKRRTAHFNPAQSGRAG